MTETGIGLMALSIATFAVIAQWISQGAQSDDDVLRFLSSLKLQQHETMTSLVVSAISFLILGLALCYAPTS